MTELEFIQFLNKKFVTESESSPTEVISQAVLFVHPLRGAQAKKAHECHARWHNLCEKQHIWLFRWNQPLYGLLPRLWLLVYTHFSDRNSAKKNALWGGTYPYGLYKGVPSAGLYHSPTGTSTCILINDFPCRRGKFDATSVLFIYFDFFLGSDMTIKLKLYFKILFMYEQNLSVESKTFTNVPYRRDHLRIVPK